MCGTALGNAIAPMTPIAAMPATPAAPPPTQPHPVEPPPPAHPAVLDRTQYQSRVPAVIPPVVTPDPQVPLLKLIHSSGREFPLFGESGYIGRRSPTKPVPPEIDLTGIPGEDIISRHHARVTWDWSHNAYTIVDLSTNGIYLNGSPLTAGVPYRLANGDTLQLGQENVVNFQVSVR
jgi:pSer/pThr/pTyr-binding forkhead associated (FHA) protein